MSPSTQLHDIKQTLTDTFKLFDNEKRHNKISYQKKKKYFKK